MTAFEHRVDITPDPSLLAYTGGCRCEGCGDLRYWDRKDYRKRLILAGTTRSLVDSAPARTNIAALVAEGFPVMSIARSIGMAQGVLLTFLRDSRSKPERVEFLVNLTRDHVLANTPPHSRVPSLGACRRARALGRMGWSFEHIADGQLDVKSLARIRPDVRIAARTHRHIVEVYDRLAMTKGPSRRSALWCEKRGFPPPLAWDDEDLDDPAGAPHINADASVDPSVVARLITGGERVGSNTSERRVAIQTLAERGLSAEQIAERMRVSVRTVVRHRSAA